MGKIRIRDVYSGAATTNLTRRDWRENKKNDIFVSLYLNIAVSRSRISSGTGVLYLAARRLAPSTTEILTPAPQDGGFAAY